MRRVLEENGQASTVLAIKHFHGIGAFEVHLSKVSALKLSHPSVCSTFRVFWPFRNDETVSREGEEGEISNMFGWNLFDYWCSVFGIHLFSIL
jgi:hypothetical protein